MAILTIDPARVTVHVVSPGIEKAVPLVDLLAGATVDGQPVYKMGCHCYNCPGPNAGGCSYVVALDYSLDGGDWVTDGAWADVLPLPLCPVVHNIAAGKMTWADVFKNYWADDWADIYANYTIDDNAAAAACNAYAAWQAAQMVEVQPPYNDTVFCTCTVAQAVAMRPRVFRCMPDTGCAYGDNMACPYYVGFIADADVMPCMALPLCPIAQAVADGKLTWDTVQETQHKVDKCKKPLW